MKNTTAFIFGGIFVVLVIGFLLAWMLIPSVGVFIAGIKPQAISGQTSSGSITRYSSDNLTVVFENDEKVTLKSHQAADEILEVAPDKNQTLIWYEFFDFKDVSVNGLGEVTFIDLAEDIVDPEGKNLNDTIPNPNFNRSIKKSYHYVILQDNEWVPYNSKDIPTTNITIGISADIIFGEYLDVIPEFLGANLTRHALVLGTNAGFVSTAPTGDPEGIGNSDLNANAWGLLDTSPASITRITEIGVYIDGASSDETAFDIDIGVYTSDGAPLALIHSTTINHGTSIGVWAVASGLDWDIDAETDYWLTVTGDNGGSRHDMNFVSTGGGGGQGWNVDLGVGGSLPSTWQDDATDADGMVGVYVLTDAGGGGDSCTCAGLNTNWEINLSDSCLIYTDCDLGNGNITWVGTGTVVFNSTIEAKNMDAPPNNGLLKIGPQCLLKIG